MKNLADRPGHIINAAPPFFGWKKPECGVALWIQVDDQDPFVMICGQTSTNMDCIRGLTHASFEIDKRDYLAHLASLGYVVVLSQTDLLSRNEKKFGANLFSSYCA
jgi:hypothetical protein